MRYGIFSDIHANSEALEAVLDAFGKEGVDQLLCVGDVVGYGANPRECCQIVASTAAVIVAGNHDWASVGLFNADYFNDDARKAVLWTRTMLDESSRNFLESLKLTYQNDAVTLVHGSLNNPKEFQYILDCYATEETFQLMKTDVCFIGHTHVTGVFMKYADEHIGYNRATSFRIESGNKYIINVGSVGQPRDGDPHAAFCIYDSATKDVSIKRVAYDAQKARAKIIEAGLPSFLGDRLLNGR